MRNVPSLHPIPSQTGGTPFQTQYPVAHPQGSPVVLGPQEAVRFVTQRAREFLNDHRETALRAWFHQHGEFLAATHQYEAVARQNFVNSSARNNDTPVQRADASTSVLSNTLQKKSGACTQILTPRALLERFTFQTHLDALRTLSALSWFKVGLLTSFHEVILPECNGKPHPRLGHPVTTSFPNFLRVNCPSVFFVMRRVSR